MKYLQTDSVFDYLKNVKVFLNPVNILNEPKQITCFPLTFAWVQSTLSIICNNIRIFDASALFLESALLCCLNCETTNAPKFSCYWSRSKNHCRVLLFPFISDDRSAQSQTMLCSPVCVCATETSCAMMVEGFNSHASTDYVLEGVEARASSDSWTGNWRKPQPCGTDPARRTHRVWAPSFPSRQLLAGTRAGRQLQAARWG